MKRFIRKIANKGRHTEIVWRYGFNFLPSLNYKLSSSNKSDRAAEKLVRNLLRDGIALSSVDEFAEELEYFPELESSVEKMLETRQDELRQKKIKANDTEAIGEKTFNVELLGSKLVFDPESVYARFALQDTFLNIANTYFGMLVKLRYYNVWQTFATQSEARESQLWHFDREDQYILKLFLYLNDVDEGAGPFTYAPGTHRKGSRRNCQPEYFDEGGVRRTTDKQMAAAIPKENWLRATGKKGTIIFADTCGYHKGGESRTSDRLMFTCMFTSPASQSKRLLSYPRNLNTAKLSKKQISALFL
jgi:hypothetical protein